MRPVDFIIIGIIVVVIGLAVLYIVKAKLNGQKCIGCPHSKTCKSNSEAKSCCCGSNENE